jgi:hypothetical protein
MQQVNGLHSGFRFRINGTEFPDGIGPNRGIDATPPPRLAAAACANHRRVTGCGGQQEPGTIPQRLMVLIRAQPPFVQLQYAFRCQYHRTLSDDTHYGTRRGAAGSQECTQVQSTAGPFRLASERTCAEHGQLPKLHLGLLADA